MKLYFSPAACSLAPHIAMIEAGLKAGVERVDLRAKKFSGGDYLSINPKGSVPALQFDDGTVLTEAAVILQFIADQKPEKHLIPRSGTMERYRAQEWLNYISSELHKGFSPLWKPDTAEDMKIKIKETLANKFEFLSQKLSQKSFLMGEQYTVADSYLFTILSWAPRLKVDLTPWPVLLGYIEKIKSRPATIEAMKQEHLTT
jgi:glutathione S-transferase